MSIPTRMIQMALVAGTLTACGNLVGDAQAGDRPRAGSVPVTPDEVELAIKIPVAELAVQGARIMWVNAKGVWYYSGNIAACTPTPGPKPKWEVDMIAARRSFEAAEYFSAMRERGEAPQVHFTAKCEVVPPG